MSDLSGRLRTALSVYDQSYPPDVLGGGTDPHINTVSPQSSAVNSGLSIATLNGRNFAADSVVEINQVGVQSQFDSATQMQFETNLVALGVGTHMVTVRNVDDQESNSAAFTITAEAPLTITSITPTTGAQADGNVTIEINGTGFDRYATVTQDDQDIGQPDWHSNNHLTAYLDWALEAAAGTYQIKVVNEDSAESNAVPFVWTATTATTTETEPGEFGTVEYDYPSGEAEDD